MKTMHLAVAGASGQLGSLVVNELIGHRAGRPGMALTAITRTPGRHAAWQQQGVGVRCGDFDQPQGLASAFHGVERLLLISTNTLDGTGRRVAQHQHAIEAARRAGVAHIVYTSFLQPQEGKRSLLNDDHRATEALLAGSGMAHTILRNAFYQDLLLAVLGTAAVDGRLRTAMGTGHVSYVAREDCAHAAAAALSDGYPGSRILDITGPAAPDAPALAAMAALLSGKPVEVVNLDAEERARHFIATGMPAPMAQMLAGIERWLATDAMHIVSDDYRALTGRQASPVPAFLHAHRRQLLALPPA
ncbi:NAD(P)H-binding protein [Janthinobacterium sp. SUN211]|uniref:NAD(P)H-binding protein n=1 Tax=Janthinobacterium sp. SUN211 TaxID=3014786 RepID=UPI0027127960|nr:NAD(P)H-binding protein [Janthinobacterium sp. SUN211]MDO8051830.1 NAD(P)H-binding protein [Janthinobacterium sp. SUN211]